MRDSEDRCYEELRTEFPRPAWPQLNVSHKQCSNKDITAHHGMIPGKE